MPRCLVLVVIAVALGMPATAMSQPRELPTLVVQVANAARLAPDLLEAAKGTVVEVFAAARVNIQWVDQPRPTPLPGGPDRRRRIALDLVRTPAAAGKTTAGQCRVLGSAAREINRAFVFVDRLVAAGSAFPVDEGGMLAHLMAHEIGHLLLPPGSHSPDGLMRPNLDFARLQSNRFTPKQAASIRSALSGEANRN